MSDRIMSDRVMADGGTTDDRFLGGKLLMRQPKRGHRAGHDAILLAASVAAKAGQRVIDLGAGVGAAGLALAARVPGIDLTLLEIDPALAAIAGHNAATNGVSADIVTADVADRNAITSAFDVVLMNPPFHDAPRHRASPDAGRRAAHVASEETLSTWISAAHRLLKSKGELTMIWRADGLAEVLAGLVGRFGGIAVQPVHAAQAKPALRILIRAVKGGRGPLMIWESLYLDSAQAEGALRGENALALAEC